MKFSIIELANTIYFKPPDIAFFISQCATTLHRFKFAHYAQHYHTLTLLASLLMYASNTIYKGKKRIILWRHILVKDLKTEDEKKLKGVSNNDNQTILTRKYARHLR